MKWLIRGAGILLSVTIITVLDRSSLWLYLDGHFDEFGVGLIGGLITCAVYYLGVFFIPNRIIPLAEARKAARSVIEAPPNEDVKTKCRPRRPHISGYHLAILILAALLLLCLLNSGNKTAEIEHLRAELDNKYREGYEVGYTDGESQGYAAGSEDALDDIDYHSCFSAGYRAGFEANASGRTTLEADIGMDYIRWRYFGDTDSYSSFSEWSDTAPALGNGSRPRLRVRMETCFP